MYFINYNFIAITFRFVAAKLVGDDPIYQSLCISQWAMGPYYGPYNFGLAAFGGLISCILYLVTLVVMHVQTGRLHKHTTAYHNIQRQRAVTKMMGVVSASSLCLFVVPAMGLFVYDALPIPADVQSATSPYFQTAYGLHSSANVLVYAVLREDIRAALLATLRCRRTPTVAPW